MKYERPFTPEFDDELRISCEVQQYDIKEPEDLVKQQCTDASEWAKQFVKTSKAKNWTIDQLNDEGNMIAWFASAIETTKDAMHKDNK